MCILVGINSHPPISTSGKKLSLSAGLSSFVEISLTPCHYVTSPFRGMPTIRFAQVGRHPGSMFFEHLPRECRGADAPCYVAIGLTLLHGQILEHWATVAGVILLIISHQIPINTNSLVLAEAPFLRTGPSFPASSPCFGPFLRTSTSFSVPSPCLGPF